MPKIQINYDNVIIYKIVSKDLTIKEIYVGHTTNFIQRKYNHKQSCNNPNLHGYNYKIYKYIRCNGGWDNFEMIEVEKYSCKDGNEATARERYWYETLNATLNVKLPNRSKKEYGSKYYIENKEEITEKKKKNHLKNYIENKEELIQKSKDWNKNNKEKRREIQQRYIQKKKNLKIQKNNQIYQNNNQNTEKYTEI